MFDTSKILDFLLSKKGRIIVSVILGLGLASIFRKACNDRTCMTFYAPPPSSINEKVYKFDGKCYKFVPKAKPCERSKTQVQFE